MHNQEHHSGEVHPSPLHCSWQTEREIDVERQVFLRQRLILVPHIQQGIYPFKDIPLTRADIEWLLATHEQGPINWSDVAQRERQGIDLRGADLRHVNLRGLPLARLRGGLTREEWVVATLEQRAMAGIHLEQADLSGAHLEGALLRGAFLQGAMLHATMLEESVLFQARLEQAYLRDAHLEGTNMENVHLEGTYLHSARLAGANLRGAFCNNATSLEKVTLADKQWGCALLADVHWDDCNLAVLDWQRVIPLGDEALTRLLLRAKSIREKRHHLSMYQTAVRAYRQLANAMRAQGMNDEAIPFAYRAYVLQRALLWRHFLWGAVKFSEEPDTRRKFSQRIQRFWRRIHAGAAYCFSWLLDILAGYGYKPERSLGIYVLTILAFTTVYLLIGALPFNEALIFSITAFHGRGFMPGPFSLASPVTALAAFEAVIGLFVEISFIATFTQRFFGR